MRKKYFPPFVRNCPECGLELIYTNSKNRNRAEKLGVICRSCRGKEISSRPEIKATKKMPIRRKSLPPFTRNCPGCGLELTHTTLKYKNRAEKIGTICHSCRGKEVQSRPNRKVNFGDRSGDKNSFFGKHHSEETKEKLRTVDRSYTQTKEFRRKSARIGSKNGMYGKSFYDVWKEKYGTKEANRKFSEWRKTQSKNSSGKNNPMYGKPAPKGSGGGWGGWYKGWYFRSLRELSYVIRVLEKTGQKWKSAENNRFSIPYINHDGTPRTYRPDFIVDEKVLVEVKPKQLMETPTNLLKKEAAIQFCKDNGLEFKMVDVKLLETDQFMSLYKAGKVRFNKKYSERMDLLCQKRKNP